MKRVGIIIALVAGLGCETKVEPASLSPQASKITVTVGSIVPNDYEPLAGIKITDAVIVRSAVELHLCESSSLLWSTAWAHVAASSTREGTPVVQDLVHKTGARITGDISPPPGSYCRGYVIFSPADDDALNMTDVKSSDVEGLTLLIRGTRATEAGNVPFTFTYKEPIVVGFELHDLELGPQHAHAQILVETRLTPQIAEAAAANDPAGVRDGFLKTVKLYDPKASQ